MSRDIECLILCEKGVAVKMLVLVIKTTEHSDQIMIT